VGSAIVDMLFPAGARSRIPLSAILGSRSAQGLGALVARVCQAGGQIVGLSTPAGVTVSGQRLCASDGSQQAGMRTLLLHPLLESVVVETTPETVVEEGLPFDRCDIAIVAGPELTGSGPDGTGTGDWLRTVLVLARAVDRAGTTSLVRMRSTWMS
jgi:cyanophycin synthetase